MRNTLAYVNASCSGAYNFICMFSIFFYNMDSAACSSLTLVFQIYAYIIAERRERSERSEANNRVLFEIPRYLYIYIYNYIYICLSASALCKTVHTLRKSYHVGRCVFGTLAAVRRTTLRSRPGVRYGRRRQFS